MGDYPLDEMRSAVKRIRRSYLERFGRNPWFAELLYALQATLEADPPAYVADRSIPGLGRLVEVAGARAASEHIEPSDKGWEEFRCGAIRGISGQYPRDEMRSAVKRIRRSYLERFGRNPYLAELLYALQGTVEVDPPAYAADPDVPSLERLVEAAGTGTAFEHIDPGSYVGALDAESDDFLVYPRVNPPGPLRRETMVLRGELIEQGANSVLCRYRILAPSITDGMAHSLIRQCVLQDLLDYDIIDGGLTIRFERTA
jgi:hypothetical protein